MVVDLNTYRTYRQTVRARIRARLRNVTEAATKERIAEESTARHRALLRNAVQQGIWAEPDPGHIGRFITRMTARGRCNLTTTTSCTCKEFRLWRRCPCQALVIEETRSLTIAERHDGAVSVEEESAVA